ncbi:MAG: hypothetical protein HY064_10790 [Bacteroidetes bacterium]|nr:hypothetical protein [Bacteroidota bacterium]
MHENDTKSKWNKLLSALEPQFGSGLDVQAILFIIGVQELGHGFRKLTKEEKVDVMHIAICTLLEPYGYYKFEGRDADNWPHWVATSKLPNLQAGQQNRLIIEAIIDYFSRNEMI